MRLTFSWKMGELLPRHPSEYAYWYVYICFTIYINLIVHVRLNAFFKGGKPASYELEVRASPGNISSIEHILFGEGDVVRDCNYLVGVRLQGSGDKLMVGVAAVDTSLNLIQVIIRTRTVSCQEL